MPNSAKKDLKALINNNGFWLQIDDIEKVERNDIKLSKDAVKTKADLPKGENILFFKGKASQNFAKGKVSRNEYKIDTKGWDLTGYKNNAQILLSHNPEQPIGKTLSLTKSDDGLDIVYFVNLSWMNEVDANRMRDGAFSGLSTGHITREYKFENAETGEVMDEEQANEKYGLDRWDLFMSEAWNMIVTKAELVEISAVTLPSNPDALTVKNSLKQFFDNEMSNLKKNLKDAGLEINEEEEKDAAVAEEAEGTVKAEAKEEVTEEKTEDPAVEGESPEAATEGDAEQAEPVDAEQAEPVAEGGDNSIKSLEVNQLQNALTILANASICFEKQINEIKVILDKIPAAKTVLVTKQLDDNGAKAKPTKSVTALGSLFVKNGIKIN